MSTSFARTPGRMALGLLICGLFGTVATAELPPTPTLPDPPTSLAWDRQGEITFASRSPFDFDVLLAGSAKSPLITGIGTLFLPSLATADRQVSGVIILHGSGGISPGREMSTADMLAKNGIAAFVVDYYRARGVSRDTPYLERVMAVTEFDAVADAYGALSMLASHPVVDEKRIALIGFSYGGMATRLALDARVREALRSSGPGFAAHVDFYGPCHQDFGTTQTTGAPMLTLRGGQDASNDLVACAGIEGDLRKAGSVVDAIVFGKAGHGWEVDRPRALSPSPYVAGCRMVYDARGFPSVDGRPLPMPAEGATREQRSALRAASGETMKDCVKNGYIVGRDDATRTRSERRVLEFLRRAMP